MDSPKLPPSITELAKGLGKVDKDLAATKQDIFNSDFLEFLDRVGEQFMPTTVAGIVRTARDYCESDSRGGFSRFFFTHEDIIEKELNLIPSGIFYGLKILALLDIDPFMSRRTEDATFLGLDKMLREGSKPAVLEKLTAVIESLDEKQKTNIRMSLANYGDKSLISIIRALRDEIASNANGTEAKEDTLSRALDNLDAELSNIAEAHTDAIFKKIDQVTGCAYLAGRLETFPNRISNFQIAKFSLDGDESIEQIFMKAFQACVPRPSSIAALHSALVDSMDYADETNLVDKLPNTIKFWDAIDNLENKELAYKFAILYAVSLADRTEFNLHPLVENHEDLEDVDMGKYRYPEIKSMVDKDFSLENYAMRFGAPSECFTTLITELEALEKSQDPQFLTVDNIEAHLEKFLARKPYNPEDNGPDDGNDDNPWLRKPYSDDGGGVALM